MGNSYSQTRLTAYDIICISKVKHHNNVGTITDLAMSNANLTAEIDFSGPFRFIYAQRSPCRGIGMTISGKKVVVTKAHIQSFLFI